MLSNEPSTKILRYKDMAPTKRSRSAAAAATHSTSRGSSSSEEGGGRKRVRGMYSYTSQTVKTVVKINREYGHTYKQQPVPVSLFHVSFFIE